MLTSKDAILVYETLLMFPGMNDNVKLPFSLKRKSVLMLAKLMEQVLGKEAPGEGVLGVMDDEVREELKEMAKWLLQKGGLSEFSDRLAALNLK